MGSTRWAVHHVMFIFPSKQPTEQSYPGSPIAGLAQEKNKRHRVCRYLSGFYFLFLIRQTVLCVGGDGGRGVEAADCMDAGGRVRLNRLHVLSFNNDATQ